MSTVVDRQRLSEVDVTRTRRRRPRVLPFAATGLIAVAGLGIALPGVALAGVSAAAGDPGYRATLRPLNQQTGSGTATVSLAGNVATVTLDYRGLAQTWQGAPFPHAGTSTSGDPAPVPARVPVPTTTA